MTTKAQFARITQAMEKSREEATASAEAAKSHLVRLGIYDKSGKMAKEYGGSPQGPATKT